MSFTSVSSPSFCSQGSFVPAPKTPKSSSDVIKEQTHEKAKEAKNKPREEKTVGDYLNIGIDAVNNLADNVPVVYVNTPQKLNYIAWLI